MAKKPVPKKGWKASNQNPGGSKSTPTKMLDAITSTSKFGVGMKKGDGHYSRIGEGDIKHARTRKKPSTKK